MQYDKKYLAITLQRTDEQSCFLILAFEVCLAHTNQYLTIQP